MESKSTSVLNISVEHKDLMHENFTEITNIKNTNLCNKKFYIKLINVIKSK